MRSSSIAPSNLPLTGISSLEPKSSRIGDTGDSVKPPSPSLLQRLVGAITKRRLIQFAVITGIFFIVFSGPPSWAAAISVLLGLIVLIQSNESPNEPVFSGRSKNGC